LFRAIPASLGQPRHRGNKGQAFPPSAALSHAQLIPASTSARTQRGNHAELTCELASVSFELRLESCETVAMRIPAPTSRPPTDLRLSTTAHAPKEFPRCLASHTAISPLERYVLSMIRRRRRRSTYPATPSIERSEGSLAREGGRGGLKGKEKQKKKEGRETNARRSILCSRVVGNAR
jgi:hypothetical protein